ncbi:M20 metallopeptidase family protein [Mycetocola spongiae]|uniref:M20 metallopeptidase family protein n=1 Tax=Mycetocola spongiae TaxID=2859226 RepID=UPI001CF1438B|nr:M20 family metallopeptidase [Mycetocola spongiae]UCR88891.1 amidohydrolase [Mycetocola spongiae]
MTHLAPTPGQDGATTVAPTDFARIAADAIRLRRELHRRPEVGLDLPETRATLLRELEGLGLEISLGEGCTSITAVLRGGAPTVSPAPVVLLRADMDGLPVREDTGVDFASEIPGAMHACGHDLHMAMLIGATRVLAARRDSLAGDVILMFQPGEEGFDGASVMIREGVLEAAGPRPLAAYALHVFSSGTENGRFALRPGTIMSASDVLAVTVRGQGGHGSTPYRAKDPVTAAAEMITALQVMITRTFDVFDPAVISVGVLSAGIAENVIPDRAEFRATVRTFSVAAREKMMATVPDLLRGIASAHGVEVDVDYVPGYPPTVNDPEETRFAEAAIVALGGPEALAVLDHPMSASEDFSRVLEEVPGAFIGLGAIPIGDDVSSAAYNHSPHAVFDDEVVPRGIELLTHLAVTRLAAGIS